MILSKDFNKNGPSPLNSIVFHIKRELILLVFAQILPESIKKEFINRKKKDN